MLLFSMKESRLHVCDFSNRANVSVGFRGLLVSKMYDTAKSIVNNLLFQLDEYGHVLNGARTYYVNRRYLVAPSFFEESFM